MNERDARRKLLLLQGTLYRVEIMHAKQSLREAASGNALAAAVPGLLKSLIANKGTALVTTVLPLLLGRGRLLRYARRALLAAGGVAAAWAVISRRKGADDQETTDSASVQDK